MTNFYNPFQQRPLTTTNRASRRERLRQLQRARERGLATQVNQAQAPVVLAEPTIIPTETGDIRQQYPIVSPQMLPERQAEFQTQQAVQRPTQNVGRGYGVVIEATKVAAGNTTALLDAATDIDVAIATHCMMQRHIVEDSLGRTLTDEELYNISDSIVFTSL